MKKYKLRCSYCGSTIYKYEWLLKLHYIFFKSYTLNCKVCHKKSVWINNFVLKHDTLDKEEKNFNRMTLFDERLR